MRESCVRTANNVQTLSLRRKLVRKECRLTYSCSPGTFHFKKKNALQLVSVARMRLAIIRCELVFHFEGRCIQAVALAQLGVLENVMIDVSLLVVE